MSVDMKLLTPLPWVYDERIGIAGVYAAKPPECLLQDLPKVIASKQGTCNQAGWLVLDAADCENMKFVALASRAFEIMMRRGWSVINGNDGWYVVGGGVEDNTRAGDYPEDCLDPFTALVETDKWMKEREQEGITKDVKRD